ncbi:MAG: formylglycine-generating enzyme family protein [Thermoguttaceae bacterium]
MTLKSSLRGAFDFRTTRTGALRGSTGFGWPRESPRSACNRWGKAAARLLSPVGSLAALLILFWLLNSGVDHLMDATDYLGTDPARDHVYWDMEFRSTEGLDRFPPEHRRITNSLGMQLALIPAGRFIQGSPSSEDARAGDELPHRVHITRPFYLGVHDVTVGQFQRFVENTGYRTDGEKDPSGVPICIRVRDNTRLIMSRAHSWRNPGFAQGETYPVVDVSWYDAVEFCRWLSGLEGQSYRLPTEAEWEYACRAGSVTRFSCGNDESTLLKTANVKVLDPEDLTRISDHDSMLPVGSLAANAFGLYDMHGNVSQWCADWYDWDYYARAETEDPQGPSAGDQRVVRGGSFSNHWAFARSARRLAYPPHKVDFNIGFRVARSCPDL